MPKQYADDAYFLSLYPQFKILQRAQWRVTVLSAVPATEYGVEAEPVPYAVTAAIGETITSLRGKLKSAINDVSLIVTAASNLTAELIVTEVKAATVSLAVYPEDGLSIELITPSDATAALRAAWLEATQSSIDLCVWGEKAAAGHASLAAHYIAMALGADPNTGLSASNISSMREGPASVTFGVGGQQSGQGGDIIAATAYGRQYLALHRTLVLTPIADVGNFGCGTGFCW